MDTALKFAPWVQRRWKPPGNQEFYFLAFEATFEKPTVEFQLYETAQKTHEGLKWKWATKQHIEDLCSDEKLQQLALP